MSAASSLSFYCGQLRGPWLLAWCSVNRIKNIRFWLIVSSQENEMWLTTEPDTVVVSLSFTLSPKCISAPGALI